MFAIEWLLPRFATRSVQSTNFIVILLPAVFDDFSIDENRHPLKKRVQVPATPVFDRSA